MGWDIYRCQVLVVNAALLSTGIGSLTLGIMYKLRAVDDIGSVMEHKVVYPWVLIGLGVFQIVLSFFGAISIYIVSVVLLGIVTLCLFLLISVQIAYAMKASISPGDMRVQVYAFLNNTFEKMYLDSRADMADLHLIQSHLLCCGIWGVESYRYAPPSSCCGRMLCKKHMAYGEGCVVALSRYFEKEARLFSTSLFGAIFVEILAIGFLIWIMYVMQRAKESTLVSLLYRRTNY